MLNRDAVKKRLAELGEEVRQKTDDYEAGRISDKNYYRKFVQKAYDEAADLESELRTYNTAVRFSGGTEVNAPQYGTVPGNSLVGGYEQILAPSPLDLTQAQVSGLFHAAQARTPFSVTVKPKSFRDGIQSKPAVTEAGIGGLYAVGIGYESTRVSDLLPGAAMPGPSATWLSHTANTNEAGIAAEGAPKVDLGPTITEHQVIYPPKSLGRPLSRSRRSWIPTSTARGSSPNGCRSNLPGR